MGKCAFAREKHNLHITHSLNNYKQQLETDYLHALLLPTSAQKRLHMSVSTFLFLRHLPHQN